MPMLKRVQLWNDQSPSLTRLDENVACSFANLRFSPGTLLSSLLYGLWRWDIISPIQLCLPKKSDDVDFAQSSYNLQLLWCLFRLYSFPVPQLVHDSFSAPLYNFVSFADGNVSLRHKLRGFTHSFSEVILLAHVLNWNIGRDMVQAVSRRSQARVQCRSQWPCGLRRGSAAVRLLGLWVRNPPGAWMFVLCLL